MINFTTTAEQITKVSETVRMQIRPENLKSNTQRMVLAKIGIPAGLSPQPWQLKELHEKNVFDYYEIFDNYLVFYYRGFLANEKREINLDLKAEYEGKYTAPASSAYLYYYDEYKSWNKGCYIEIRSLTYLFLTIILSVALC